MERQILEQCYREGTKPPEAIRNAPELYTGLWIFMRAFNELMPSRPDGGMIPWSEMKDWAVTHNDDEEFVEDLIYFVREMDVAYLNWKKKTKTAPIGKPNKDKDKKPRKQFGAG